MDPQAEICETYQLKWSSYNTYMNQCIATSLHNESYFDVALVTCDGHQIMAHRYVLSYSSLFLAQVLRLQRKVTTSLPLMIVLPPEIDYKSLKVLVRYMYSGEAKVSKEILQTVLRGGDILQIKGLYREKEDQDKNVKITQNQQKTVPSPALTPTSQCSSSPKIPPLAPVSSNTPPITTIPTAQSSTPILINSATAKKAPTPSTSGVTTQKPNPLILRKPLVVGTAVNPGAAPPSLIKFAEQHKFLVVQKPKQTFSKEANAIAKQKVLNFTIMQACQGKDDGSKKMTILNKALDISDDKGELKIKTEPKDSLQYLMIKDEPLEWTEAMLDEHKDVYDEAAVKSENDESNAATNESIEEDEEDQQETLMFSPLTCELCTETFTVPREWVRHVQTHTDMLPAKRRRRDSTGDSYENDTFPELMCDLCQKSFPTPAEWVRHIQSSHSEFELHMSNRKNGKGGGQEQSAPTPTTSTAPKVEGKDGDQKHCFDCNKSFPSHASMVIHQRRHTGEKPYACQFCSKTFNVKSNLLRHLRTLHNKIFSSSEIDNKEMSDDDVHEEEDQKKG